jgi:hypothetical protein
MFGTGCFTHGFLRPAGIRAMTPAWLASLGDPSGLGGLGGAAELSGPLFSPVR